MSDSRTHVHVDVHGSGNGSARLPSVRDVAGRHALRRYMSVHLKINTHVYTNQPCTIHVSSSRGVSIVSLFLPNDAVRSKFKRIAVLAAPIHCHRSEMSLGDAHLGHAPSIHDLRRTLDGQTVLFVGDSTLRAQFTGLCGNLLCRRNL